MWIQRQSSISCRGTRACHSMDSISSVRNKIYVNPNRIVMSEWVYESWWSFVVFYVLAFRTGKYGKNVWTGKSRERERERESSYGDSKRWMRREKGEGEIENKDNHATNTFFMNLSRACMWHAWEVWMWLCTRFTQEVFTDNDIIGCPFRIADGSKTVLFT